jgi:hypothetical protein
MHFIPSSFQPAVGLLFRRNEHRCRDSILMLRVQQALLISAMQWDEIHTCLRMVFW